MIKQIIIVGRGHSGTRLPLQLLHARKVFTGTTNDSGDHIPPQSMYEAVRLFGPLIEGDGYNWDFSKALNTPAPQAYRELVYHYLAEFNHFDCFAWKLPEAVLALPWLIETFPDAYYIHWLRDGRDNILSWHGTEQDWYGVKVDLPEDRLTRAAMSWHYHEELIAATPKPRHWLQMRYEDFLARQLDCIEVLSDFLGMPLMPIGQYKNHDLNGVMPILEKNLARHGYLENEG